MAASNRKWWCWVVSFVSQVIYRWLQAGGGCMPSPFQPLSIIVAANRKGCVPWWLPAFLKLFVDGFHVGNNSNKRVPKGVERGVVISCSDMIVISCSDITLTVWTVFYTFAHTAVKLKLLEILLKFSRDHCYWKLIPDHERMSVHSNCINRFINIVSSN